MKRVRARLAGQRGFTLVELLVAMAAGLVVITGATALIMTGLNTTASVAARVQAVQNARVGMDELIQQLNSGCLVSGVSPIQATTAAGISPVASSSQSQLVFISGVQDSATPTPTEHVVELSGGALVDISYPYSGTPAALDTPTAWTFSATPTATQTLIPGATAPAFTYYSYSNPANPTQNSLVGAKPLATPLSSQSSAVNAAEYVARIDIDVTAQPTVASEQADNSATFDDSATFRLTTADPSGPNYPCE